MKKTGFLALLATLSLSMSAQIAHIQFINNCPIPKADSVDIYIDNQLIADNLPFRGATAFLEVQAGAGRIIKVVEKDKPDANSSWYTSVLTLEANKDYIAIAEGLFIFGSETYNPVKDFNLSIYQPAQDSATASGTVDLMFSHGATDFTEFDLNEQTIPYYEIVNNINYGMKTPYIQLNPDSLVVEVLITWNFLSYNKYVLDLRPYAGKAVSLLASGFMNPATNNNGPEFGLFLATPEGGQLLELPVWEPIGINELNNQASIDIWPNPVSQSLFISKLDDSQRIEIFSVSGECLLVNDLVHNSIDVSNLPAGCYLARIHQGNQVITKPFVKKAAR